MQIVRYGPKQLPHGICRALDHLQEERGAVEQKAGHAALFIGVGGASSEDLKDSGGRSAVKRKMAFDFLP